MRRNYRYAVMLVLLSVLLWCGCYLYMQYLPAEYENGTFVELPEQTEGAQEMTA